MNDYDLVHRDIMIPRQLDRELAALASSMNIATGQLIIQILTESVKNFVAKIETGKKKRLYRSIDADWNAK